MTMVLDYVPAGVPLQFRHFKANRQTSGTITVTYTAKVTPAFTPRKRGPSYDLRGTEGGAGGAYFSFLLLPLQAPKIDLNLVWDTSALPSGAKTVSTSGPANIKAQLAPMEVYPTFFLTGNVKGTEAEHSSFQAHWIGTPPFNTQTMTDWSSKTFGTLEAFFKDQDKTPYTLLMRPYTRPRDGGGAARGGFMLEYGQGRMDDASRRIMFAHEMIHHFVSGLDGDSSAVAWYGEGLAEFYKLRLTLDAGLIHVNDIGREIGYMTRTYYASSLVATPYSDLAKARWDGSDAQSIPYSRGFMYFVDLNAQIRTKSEGKRSLDNLVLAMLERKRSGQPYDETAWRALLLDELGASGIEGLDQMLQGKVIIPTADAFGQCFKRQVSNHPRTNLGMSEDSFLMTPYKVTGLIPGSAADKSGLKDGDDIISFTGVRERIAHSAANVVADPKVDIVVQRGSTPTLFSFSTEDAVITGYKWNFKNGPSDGCSF
ncbi:hypothetical protein [Asticcacaulis machinosus]|uniref:PDZ domain-containing protein n=1 Tax=Asticcacaulis machinosus TaxID=2984211 RepID=A0ABT5HNQ3_9CAUL|nr:hypothetical protein [Asticcacaulis machinosus]MDC7677802.1 hypothetical protein [Asticcacaulis machinosus]